MSQLRPALLLLLGLGLLPPGPVRAAAAAGAEAPLTLDLAGALALARRHAPDLLVARADAAAAEGALVDADRLLQYDPVVSLGGGPRLTDTGAVPDLEAGLTQVFELGGRGAARRDAAEAGLAAAAAGVENVERRILAEVAEAFLQARHARARLALLRSAYEVAGKVQSVAVRRHRAGDVGGIEPGLAAVAAERAEGRVAHAEAEASVAEGLLRVRLGLGPERPLVLSAPGHETRGPTAVSVAGEPQQSAALPPAEVLLARAEARADLAGLEARVRAAQAEARLARSRAWPDVGVSVGWAREEEADVVGLGLSIPLPLTGEGRGAALAAERRAERLAEALAARRRAVQAEVTSALAAAHALARAAERARVEQLARVSEVATAARVAYEAGAMPLPELLAVRRELLDARLGQLDLDLASDRARVAVLAAAGWPELPAAEAPTFAEGDR